MQQPRRLRSIGREPWIFGADSLAELPGAHGDALAAALEPGERLLSLLYAPMWDARATPFGLPCRPASHAVAVTESGFVVSADPHRPGEPPAVRRVRFLDVVVAEWGESLLTGWLALYSAAPGAPPLCLTFRTTAGRHHLAAALRRCRGKSCGAPRQGQPGRGWEEVPEPYGELVAPLLLPGEPLLFAAHGRERWVGGGRRRRCVASEGVLLATPYGVLQAEKAPRPVPDPLNFARRARFAPWPRVAGLEARDMGQVGPPLLRVACAGGGTAVELVIAPPDAEAAASQLAALRSRQREVPCPS